MMLLSTNQHLNQTPSLHQSNQHHQKLENHHNPARQCRNYLLSFIEGLPLLLGLLLLLAECDSDDKTHKELTAIQSVNRRDGTVFAFTHFTPRQRFVMHQITSSQKILALEILKLFRSPTTSLVVPNELPSILSLVYSNIPPIKKGTDSRLGFGFRLGEQADFQILLELGPQKETRPIGNQDNSDGSSFNKRQVNRSQQRAVQREVAKAEKPPTTWLEKWSSQVNNVPKKKVAPKDIPAKKQASHKPIGMQFMPPLPPQVPNQAFQQLQMLYKMATTTEENIAITPSTTTATSTTALPNIRSTSTTAAPLMAAAVSHLQERLKLLQAPADVEELQALMEKSQAEKKSEITKELMDVSLEE